MTVYVLEVEASAQEMKTRWVEKDVRSMADRLLFLGTPCSFAVDASRLGRHGGCAYFVYCRKPCEKVGVFSYNLLSNKATFFERLPQGWNDERCTWHVLQPNVSPIQVINKEQQNSHIIDLFLWFTLFNSFGNIYLFICCNIKLIEQDINLATGTT
jgi:hypothetical protein